MASQAASRAGRATASLWGGRADRRRAMALLRAGLLGAHATALPVVAGFGILHGAQGAASAAIAAAVVIVFYTVGQSVQVAMAQADPRQVLAAAVASYAVRAAALGVLLNAALGLGPRIAAVQPDAVLAASIATVVGWLGGEVARFHVMPRPVYDVEYHAPEREALQ